MGDVFTIKSEDDRHPGGQRSEQPCMGSRPGVRVQRSGVSDEVTRPHDTFNGLMRAAGTLTEEEEEEEENVWRRRRRKGSSRSRRTRRAL